MLKIPKGSWARRRSNRLLTLTVQRRVIPLDFGFAAASGFRGSTSESVYNTPDFRGGFMDVRSLQRPLKDRYRQDPASARITLTARGSQTDAPVSCSIDLGRAIYDAQAHQGVGGAGTGACSGDLLLGALAACAQITCQMVAAAMGIPTESIDVTVEGDLDLQGTLGISKEAPVGFQNIRVLFDVRAPQATKEQLSALQAKTEQYCVVMQTLQHPPAIEHKWQ
jgi:uncharacterized OsmC-like protein